MRFRRSVGLRHDAPYVRALLADSGPSEEAWVRHGTPVTDEEQRRLDKEEAWHAQTYETIARYVRGRAVDVFAGITAAWSERGLEVSVGFTADVERHLDCLRAVCDRPDHITAFAARFTEDQLDAIAEQLARDWERWEREGVALSWLSVNLASNCVEVGIVAALSAHHRACLYDAYGDAICIAEHVGVCVTASNDDGKDSPATGHRPDSSAPSKDPSTATPSFWPGGDPSDRISGASSPARLRRSPRGSAYVR